MKKQSIQNVTVNKAMEGYFSTLELEHIKLDYDVITKELSRLDKLDKILESTDRKRENIPILKERQETLKQRYNALYQIAEEWLNYSFNSKPEKHKVLLVYYKDIKKNNLQDVINRLHPPTLICSENKKEGRFVPLYCASNLRQEMCTAWKGQIEGR